MWCKRGYVLPIYVSIYFGVKGNSLINFRGYFSIVFWEFYRFSLWHWMDCGTMLVSLALSFFVTAIVFFLYAFGFPCFFFLFQFFFLLFIALQVLTIFNRWVSFQSTARYSNGWWVIVFFHIVDGDGICCPRIIFYISK